MPVASLSRRALNGTSGRNQNAESYNPATSLVKVLILWVLLVHGELAPVSFNGFGLIKSSKEVPIEGLSRGYLTAHLPN